MWFLPISMLVTTTILAIPLGRYLAWIMDGKYHAPRVFRWFEKRLDTGPQNWKQYTASILIFNTVLFVFGYIVLVAAAVDAPKSTGQGDAGPDDHPAFGNFVHDQYRSAALLRRSYTSRISARSSSVLPTSSCRLRSGFAVSRR